MGSSDHQATTVWKSDVRASRHEGVEGAERTRTRVLESQLVAVDNLCARSCRHARPEGFSPDFQVCFPYRGLFIWHVGGDDIVGDANQVLFVRSGEAYAVSEPARVGYGELIVTPAVPLLSDLAGTSDTGLSSHPLFARRNRRANATLQNLRSRVLHRATSGDRDVLPIEELLIELLRCALRGDPPPLPPRGPTLRLIRRTKVFLEDHASSPIRLIDVARAVGISPAYLTDVFRRVEGVPLHRYLIQLRLARALVELPHANDLTQLALQLGFSSHSHFSAAFRREFECTPSDFRALTRRAQNERTTRPARGWNSV
jgi:AraC family transcriptional regulator